MKRRFGYLLSLTCFKLKITQPEIEYPLMSHLFRKLNSSNVRHHLHHHHHPRNH